MLTLEEAKQLQRLLDRYVWRQYWWMGNPKSAPSSGKKWFGKQEKLYRKMKELLEA